MSKHDSRVQLTFSASPRIASMLADAARRADQPLSAYIRSVVVKELGAGASQEGK